MTSSVPGASPVNCVDENGFSFLEVGRRLTKSSVRSVSRTVCGCTVTRSGGEEAKEERSEGEGSK